MTQQLERTIRCTPDNEAEFRAAIKSDPHLLQLMKGLQAQGVFPGLRAVTLTVTGDAQTVARGLAALHTPEQPA